jgi:hypothetical protein
MNSQNAKIQTYLKYCMFNDAFSNAVYVGCNHNAMDRCCILEGVACHITLPSFQDFFDKEEIRYQKNKRFPEGYEPSWDEVTEEPYYDVRTNPSFSIEEIEEYADEIAAAHLEGVIKRSQDEEWVKKTWGEIVDWKEQCQLHPVTEPYNPRNDPETIEEDRIVI